ncbi:MAG TPA: M48 family metallopeptidase [Candidatus Omnitrophota bacterium]|nr:M48 family metallopeptidase [Candidatus Omnitrophota bacterium]HPS36647.1 M48 family metallopeptidase [Candidatus Omnitrophota bacterium]
MKNVAAFFVILLLTGCSTVPITGRKQLSFIPEGQLLTLSDQNYKQVISQSTLSTDAAKTQEVVEVGKKIAAAAESFMKDSGMEADLKNYKWEFNLVKDDKTVNAFCMPGGKIVVYTGILPVTQDDNGLATVMSHEVAHAIANHGGERMSQEMVVQLGGMGLSQAMKTKPAATQKIMMQAYGAGTQYGVLLPYSRSHESEADHIGLILMARAGYDPEKAVVFWERMNAIGGTKPPEFLSTHPATSRRIADIQKEIPEAEKYYKS